MLSSIRLSNGKGVLQWLRSRHAGWGGQKERSTTGGWISLRSKKQEEKEREGRGEKKGTKPVPG
jgi:hypothetical protein